MKFGKSFIAVCLTVVADDGMEFLFGLDNIKRLRGVIDLHDNGDDDDDDNYHRLEKCIKYGDVLKGDWMGFVDG